MKIVEKLYLCDDNALRLMDKQLRYNDFSNFLSEYFPYKVQKISLNAGFTCPNRDGVKGYGGCTQQPDFQSRLLPY